MADELSIGWTTVADEDSAGRLARDMVDAGLAACVQIDGGITSVFPWKGKVDTETEWRLMVKFPAANEARIRDWLDQRHPYETPEWVVVRAADVAPEYLRWVLS